VRSQEIARRYAQAVHEVAAEDGTLDFTERELASLAEEISSVKEAYRYLAHPLVPQEEKERFLERAFPNASERMRRLLSILVRNRRETYIDLIYEEFVSLRTQAENTLRVRILTPQPLSEEDRTRVRTRLEKALKQSVVLDEQCAPWLIGGARIEVNGHVLDGSVRARLARLGKQMEG
jgi:F-type H+-transporting ATPase subunit delta